MRANARRTAELGAFRGPVAQRAHCAVGSGLGAHSNWSTNYHGISQGAALTLVPPNPGSLGYLEARRNRTGHTLNAFPFGIERNAE